MRLRLLLVVLAVWFPQQAFAQAKAPLNCKTGPAPGTFGGTSWLVYSCDDKALLIISQPDNPASPFYFLVTPVEEKGRFRIEGEGTGDRQASAAALAEIRQMMEPDVAAWIALTKQPKKPD